MSKMGRPPKDPELLKRFAKNLKKYAKAKHLTQKAIAIQMNLKPQTVSRWFNAISLPTEVNLIELLEILDVRREQIFE